MNKHIIDVMKDVDFYKQKMLNLDPNFEAAIVAGNITKEELIKFLVSMSQDFNSIANGKVKYTEVAYIEPTIIDGNITVTRNEIGRYFLIIRQDHIHDPIRIKIGTETFPLVNIDMVPINRINKGFWEVVENANFFILLPKNVAPMFLGNATPKDVKLGSEFYSGSNVLQVGTMETFSDMDIVPSVNSDIVLEWGIYDNLTIQAKQDHVLSGTANEDDVLDSYTFYKNNPKELKTGNIPDRGALVVDINTMSLSYSPGYYSGITVNPLSDLIVSSTATAGDVLAGDYFFKDNIVDRILGTMLDGGDIIIKIGSTVQIIPEGFYNSIIVQPADIAVMNGTAIQSDVVDDSTFYNTENIKKAGTIPTKNTTTATLKSSMPGEITVGITEAFISDNPTISITDNSFQPQYYSQEVSMFGRQGTLNTAGVLGITGEQTLSITAAEAIVQNSTVYTKENKTNLALGNSIVPGVLPSSGIYEAMFSHNKEYLALVVYDSPFVLLYRRSGEVFTKLPNPDMILYDTTRLRLSFSLDDSYLAIGSDVDPYFIVYKIEGNSFYKLSNPDVSPIDYINDIQFIDNTIFAVTSVVGNKILFYEIIANQISTRYMISEYPEGEVFDLIKFNEYLIVTHGAGKIVTIYELITGVYQKLNSIDVTPGTVPNSLSITKNYLVVCVDTYPYMLFYKKDIGGFVKSPNLDIVMQEGIEQIILTQDEKYLIVVSKVNAKVYFYSLNNDVLTKLAVEELSAVYHSLDITKDASYIVLAGETLKIKSIMRDIKAYIMNNFIPNDFNDLGYAGNNADIGQTLTFKSVIRNN